jgi:hypothetical protein
MNLNSFKASGTLAVFQRSLGEGLKKLAWELERTKIVVIRLLH